MIDITAIPAFSDNYLWLMEGGGETWVVDPGDGDAVRTVLEERQIDLTGILVTHHHPDHVGGIDSLLTDNMTVIGPHKNPYPLVNKQVHDDEIISLCGLSFRVIEVPGHTLNHIAYYATPEGQDPILFCGDTLFAGGCGRLFEGTPEQMHTSLSRFAELPENTLVYCAHEYTLANLAFAHTVEPRNAALQDRIESAKTLREKDIPTIPTSIGMELKTNPFMRADVEEVISAARQNNPTINDNPDSIFAEIRRMKDNF